MYKRIEDRRANGRRAYYRHKTERLKYAKAYNLAHPEKRSASSRKCNWKKSGLKITIEEYNNLFEKQHGECAICFISQNQCKNKLSVDHNHKTGKIRGLLCIRCNLGIGILEKDIRFLNRAYFYLEKYSSINLKEN